MNRFWYHVLRVFFPRRCAYCGEVTDMDALVCDNCRTAVPRMDEPVCYRCGRSVKWCTCKKHRRQFDRCVAVMAYRDGAAKAVLRLKKTQDNDIIDTMSAEMAQTLRSRCDAAAIDVVTYIPMRKKEWRRRGYNQSQLLAQAVAEHLGIPCRPLLTKLYDTASQKTLKMHCRKGNLLGVFDVTEKVEGLNILLVDDVITTGSTFHECAKMLKIREAASVTALAFAATIPKESDEDIPENDA